MRVGIRQNATNSFESQGSQSSPVAYVYVSSSPSSGNYQINGYSTSPTGKLTTIAGSPFLARGGEMALTSKWLFTTNGIDIYTSSISSTGVLKQVSSINAQKFNSCECGGPATLFLDHTGATLYDWDYNADGGLNNAYQSFDVDHDTGKLSYTGATSVSAQFFGTLSFVANNEYAYGGSCYHGDPDLYGFSRSAGGALTDLNLSTPIPAAPPNKGAYCPGSVGTNETNQIAVPLTPVNDIAIDGPTQLGVFTADSSGNLTTASTYKNMPATDVGSVSDVSASPSGLLLAIAGENGLEVFHYNGPKPITTYTGLLTTENIVQVSWDNDNHLYALAAPSSELFVFTVTPTSFSRAPGSPYMIADPAALAIFLK